MEHIVIGMGGYIHRDGEKCGNLRIDYNEPMVYRNQSVAKKVRQRANRIYCGACTEIPFVPSAYQRYDIDGEVAT